MKQRLFFLLPALCLGAGACDLTDDAEFLVPGENVADACESEECDAVAAVLVSAPEASTDWEFAQYGGRATKAKTLDQLEAELDAIAKSAARVGTYARQVKAHNDALTATVKDLQYTLSQTRAASASTIEDLQRSLHAALTANTDLQTKLNNSRATQRDLRDQIAYLQGQVSALLTINQTLVEALKGANAHPQVPVTDSGPDDAKGSYTVRIVNDTKASAKFTLSFMRGNAGAPTAKVVAAGEAAMFTFPRGTTGSLYLSSYQKCGNGYRPFYATGLSRAIYLQSGRTRYAAQRVLNALDGDVSITISQANTGCPVRATVK